MAHVLFQIGAEAGLAFFRGFRLTALRSPWIFATVVGIELARLIWAERIDEPSHGSHALLRRQRRLGAAHIGPDGVVTSLKEEHENSASRIFSNDRDYLAPHVHSRRAKCSVRPCRNEMTLGVESVVGGCVS